MIKDLNQKCEEHQLGKTGDRVQIREGIYESSQKRDMESNPSIPKNFSILQGVQTSKTSVRKTKDYPILHTRFENTGNPKQTIK